MMADRRQTTLREHIDEVVSYAVRVAVISMCAWTVYTTNNTASLVQLLEWRIMQVEVAIATRGR